MTQEQRQQQLHERQAVLTEAYQQYKALLLRYSMSKLQSKTAAEDAVQDTFIRAWSFMANGGEVDNMKSFLYRILYNLIVDEYRRRRTASLDDLVEEGFEPPDESAERTVNILDGRMIVLYIKQLPQRYKDVLSLRYIKNLSIREISEATRQSKNAVTVQIHRGLKRLKLFFPELQLQDRHSVALA